MAIWDARTYLSFCESWRLDPSLCCHHSRYETRSVFIGHPYACLQDLPFRATFQSNLSRLRSHQIELVEIFIPSRREKDGVKNC